MKLLDNRLRHGRYGNCWGSKLIIWSAKRTGVNIFPIKHEPWCSLSPLVVHADVFLLQFPILVDIRPPLCHPQFDRCLEKRKGRYARRRRTSFQVNIAVVNRSDGKIRYKKAHAL